MQMDSNEIPKMEGLERVIWSCALGLLSGVCGFVGSWMPSCLWVRDIPQRFLRHPQAEYTDAFFEPPRPSWLRSDNELSHARIALITTVSFGLFWLLGGSRALVRRFGVSAENYGCFVLCSVFVTPVLT